MSKYVKSVSASYICLHCPKNPSLKLPAEKVSVLYPDMTELTKAAFEYVKRDCHLCRGLLDFLKAEGYIT